MKNRSSTIEMLVLLCVSSAALAVAWIGYQGWLLDDFHYLKAAQAWASSAPYIGETHWELRLGLVLPLALSLSLFGTDEPAMVGVTIAFYLLSLAVNYLAVLRLWGRTHAFLSTLVVATIPMLAAWATTPRVAIAEYFYCMAAFWAYFSAARGKTHQSALMLAAGLFLGLAWITRVTAVGFFAGVALLFLLGKPIPRKKYWPMVLGVMLIIGGEVAFYSLHADNPFYRMHTSLIHGKITATGEGLESELSAPSKSDDTPSKAESFVNRLIDHFDYGKISAQEPVAQFHVNNWIDPHIQFFSEPYYGLAIWFGLPIAIILAVRHKSSVSDTGSASRLALTLAAVWVAVGLYILFLRPLPRYFLFPTYLVAMVLGLGLAEAWRAGWRLSTGAILAVYLAANLVFMEARQGLGLYNARWLISFSATVDEPVYVDDTTFEMSRPLLASNGLLERVRPGKPAPGRLYFLDPQLNPNQQRRENWEVVVTHQSEPKLLARIISFVGFDGYLSEYAYQRLAYPYGRVFVYRIRDSELGPDLD